MSCVSAIGNALKPKEKLSALAPGIGIWTFPKANAAGQGDMRDKGTGSLFLPEELAN